MGVICAAVVGIVRSPAARLMPQAGSLPGAVMEAAPERSTGAARAPAPSPAQRAASARATQPPPGAATRPPPDPLPSGTGQCPAPATCNRFAFSEDDTADEAPRWPADSAGVATVPYRINATGALTNLSADDIGNAIRASFDTWERAVPTVRFVFEGFTQSPPLPGDGLNVIGFGDLGDREDLGFAQAQAAGDNIVEADMTLVLSTRDSSGTAVVVSGWGWAPCAQQEGSCTDTRICDPTLDALGVRRCYNDLQNVVTHEIGHWLWLGDIPSGDGEALTMYGSVDTGNVARPVTERIKVTLALGDIVGARTLYPCGCPLPAILRP